MKQFAASQIFTGNNEAITICDSNATGYDAGYPKLDNNQYLILDDNQDGGYLHVQAYGGIRPYNGWDVPILTNVENLALYSGYRDTMVPSTPFASGATVPQGSAIVSGSHYYAFDGSIVDIYARFKDRAWWLFYNDSRIRNYFSDAGIPIAESATGTGRDNGYMVPYTVGGLRTYKTFALSRMMSKLCAIEYDKVLP